MKKTIQILMSFMCMGICISQVSAQADLPPAEEEELVAKVTAAVALIRAGAREESDWLLVPPYYRRVRDDSAKKEVVQKGRYEMVDVRKPIFEKFEGVGTTTVEYQERVGKVRKRRIIGYEIVKERRFIADPNGSESRVLNKYDPKAERYRIDKPILYNGFFGANGMAIDTFVRLGISPADEEFSRCIETLAEFIEVYGLPDTTYDLAWLAIGFSAVAKENPVYARIASRCVNKLLLGQQQAPKVMGMWGPVCVNTTLLASAMEAKQRVYDKELSKVIEALNAEQDEKKKERLQAKVSENKKIYDAYVKQIQDVSTHGFSMGNLTQTSRLPGEDGRRSYGGYSLEEALYHGLPVNIYAEQVVDLESTAVALYALSVVKEWGLLPTTVVIPKDARGQALVAFPGTSQLISQAATAVVRLQNPQGLFSEGIIHIPVTDFKDLVVGIDQVSAPQQAFPEVMSPESCAQGALALYSAAVIMHQDVRGISPRLSAAMQKVQPVLSQWISGEVKSKDLGYHMGMVELGVYLKPLSDVLPSVAALWPELEMQILDEWDVTAEDKLGYYSMGTPGHRELKLYRMEELHNMLLAQKGKGKPFDLKRASRGAIYADNWRFVDRLRMPALLHLRVLTSSDAPDIAGAWSWDGEAPRTTRLDPVLTVWSNEQARTFTAKRLSPAVEASDVEGLALIFVSGNGPFQPASAEGLARIQKEMAAGAVLACEAPASDEGMQFLQGIAQAVFGEGHELEEIKVGTFPVYGVMKEDMVQAVFLPLGAPSAEIPLAKSPTDGSRILYEVLKQHPKMEKDNMPFLDWASVLEMEVDQPDMTTTRQWVDARL
ncbi:hypothetical protein P3T73_00115 [Kiritimatiellota bacterium B12222]|nr:hypothetical protein P3T73_00115 [Kiritimatiellota bacterium B12222]